MKICLAQIRSIKGDILGNIESHKRFIELGYSDGAEMIIFPELSITGYEPGLAGALAIELDDSRLNDFQEISDTKHIIIGLGAPVRIDGGISIAMILFNPGKKRKAYFKNYVHQDELPFFVSRDNKGIVLDDHPEISFAICYEISIPEHAEIAARNAAKIYIASVAKFESGIEKALERLAEIARNYSMIVLMSNSVGESDGQLCAGNSSAWNDKGELLGHLNEKDEGILIFDTTTQGIL